MRLPRPNYPDTVLRNVDQHPSDKSVDYRTLHGPPLAGTTVVDIRFTYNGVWAPSSRPRGLWPGVLCAVPVRWPSARHGTGVEENGP